MGFWIVEVVPSPKFQSKVTLPEQVCEGLIVAAKGMLWLTIPAALDALGALLPGGWPEVMTRNRALALAARETIGEALRVAPAAPAEMIGSMASVPLPKPARGSAAARLGAQGLGGWLRERGVEAWLYPWPSPGGMLVRVSAQLYNACAEYERLGALLADALA